MRFIPLQLTIGFAHGDLRLVCGGSVMEIHSMNLQQTFIVMTLLPDAVWNSVLIVATEGASVLGGPVL